MGSYPYAESKLPVVEFTQTNLTPDTSLWKSTSDSVRHALETYGCVVVDYEKTRSQPQDDAMLFCLLKELFGLPLETKTKHKSQLLGFGYEGNYPRMPLFECFGIEDVKEFASLMWPHGHDKFCETVYSYRKLLSELNRTVMKMVVGSYGLGKYYDDLVASSLYMTRLIGYHPPTGQNNGGTLGLTSHRDKNFLTVVGTNEVKGLQIQTPDGEWIDFAPSDSRFVVLAGEALMAWSNGRIYCPLHRVIATEIKERYSVGFFSFIGGILQVPEELVDDHNPLKFKPFSNLEFLEYCKKLGSATEAAIQAYCGI